LFFSGAAAVNALEETDRLWFAVSRQFELAGIQSVDEAAILVYDSDGSLHQVGVDAQHFIGRLAGC